ncbi:MAG TPA: hypothetical protein VFW25_01825 [Silvibacterium sp.]|nr:hypothetical protein [Silvibacterium sp.]
MVHGSFRRGCLAAISILCLPLFGHAQNEVPDKAQVVQQMRMLYNTPTTAGLRSVSCRATVDWRGVLQSAAVGKDVAENDPRLVYLNQVSISFRFRLDGNSEANWDAPSGPVPGDAAALRRMKEGTEQMLGGFSKLWAVFLNGTALPSPQEQEFHLTRAGDGGFLLALSQGITSLDETFSADYTLKEYHVKTNGTEIDLFPTFAKSAEGLLLTRLDGTYGTGSPVSTHLTLRGDYQEVGGYQVLSSLNVALLNVGQFNFKFENCQVNQDDAHPNAPAPNKSN